MHEITIVRGQGRGGAYAEDRIIRILGVEIPSVYPLPRRDEYTRVYTTVYPRVHNSIHACTQVRSKYILCRAHLYAYSLGIIRRICSDGLRLPRIRNNPPEDPKAGVRARSCVGPGEVCECRGGRHSGGGDIYGERVALLAPLVSSQGYPLPIEVYPCCLNELDQRGQHHED